MVEHIVPETAQRALRYIYHDTIICVYAGDTGGIEARCTEYRSQKGGEVPAAGFQHGDDITVDQLLHKHGSLQIRQYAGDNADEHEDHMNFIEAEDVTHEPFQDLSRILN